MKIKYILSTLLIALMAIPLMGQDRGGDMDLASVRIAFLTKRLSLTPDEAQVFWPVYNQYQDEIQKVRQEMKSDYQASKKDFDSMSDNEVEKLVDGFVNMKETEYNIFTKYHSEFKKVLPIRKVAKLYRAEQDFTRIILQRLNRQKQRQNMNGGGRPGMRNR